MARFSGSTAPRKAAKSPLTTTGKTTTHEGGAAHTRDVKSDLFLFAAVNMVGQDTFYEAAGERDQRFRDLVISATRTDPQWVARFVPFLRTQMNMRTASVVMAAESAHERILMQKRDPMAKPLATDITVRQLVASACSRPDEPAEFLGYWWSRFGRSLPAGIKRGLADAATALYTEKAALKYDGISRSIRMGDVVELTHPTPKATWQGAVFKYLLDQRHHNDGIDPAQVTSDTQLSTLVARARLDSVPVQDRRAFLADHDAATFTAAGMTWEALSGWIQGPMDAQAWEKVIPSMGVMALIRNLRNFDEAGISEEACQLVVAKLADPQEIERSRAFPYRFLSAYLAAPSLRWGWALEQAIRLSTRNIPTLKGSTLVLLDTSGSMSHTVSDKSAVRYVDVGAVFAAALAVAGQNVELWEFADSARKFPLTSSAGVLKTVQHIQGRVGQVGYGTQTVEALKAAYKGQDRVVIVTDGQAFQSYSGYAFMREPASSVTTAIPAHVPMYGINPAGYAPSSIDLSQPNRYEIGGFSDKLFTMIAMLDEGQNADWPF